MSLRRILLALALLLALAAAAALVFAWSALIPLRYAARRSRPTYQSGGRYSGGQRSGRGDTVARAEGLVALLGSTVALHRGRSLDGRERRELERLRSMFERDYGQVPY